MAEVFQSSTGAVAGRKVKALKMDTDAWNLFQSSTGAVAGRKGTYLVLTAPSRIIWRLSGRRGRMSQL